MSLRACFVLLKNGYIIISPTIEQLVDFHNIPKSNYQSCILPGPYLEQAQGNYVILFIVTVYADFLCDCPIKTEWTNYNEF